MLPSPRAVQNMLWNIHNPGFYEFKGVYVLFQDMNEYDINTYKSIKARVMNIPNIILAFIKARVVHQ